MVESMLESIKVAVVCSKDMMEKDFGGISGLNYIDFRESEPEDVNRYHAVFSCKEESVTVTLPGTDPFVFDLQNQNEHKMYLIEDFIHMLWGERFLDMDFEEIMGYPHKGKTMQYLSAPANREGYEQLNHSLTNAKYAILLIFLSPEADAVSDVIQVSEDENVMEMAGRIMGIEGNDTVRLNYEIIYKENNRIDGLQAGESLPTYALFYMK